MSENDWKRFVEERRAVARIERELLRKNPPTTEQAVAACLELLNIYESLPVAADRSLR